MAPSPTPAAPPGPSVTRQRKHPRFPASPNTFCLLGTGRDGPAELAGVRNISRGGVGVVFARRMEPGEVVTVNLFNWKRNFACRVVMRVVYANAQADGTFFLGGAFTEEMAEEEVQWLV